MEKLSTSALLYSLSFSSPCVILFLCIFLDWVIGLRNSSLSILSFLGSCIELLICPSSSQQTETASPETKGEDGLSREDVDMVMERMRISCTQEGEQLKEYMAFDELSTMFEEKEPTLEEVEEAFSVFDENGDGFIDAMELYRVLSKLGLGDGFKLDACKQMIAVHDENEDDKIDFNEFVKFLESSLR